jgi:hypothetical protein
MDEVFTLTEWFDFIDNSDAFDIRITGKLSNEKVVIVCENGIDIFNKELYEIAIDLMDYAEDFEDCTIHLSRQPS